MYKSLRWGYKDKDWEHLGWVCLIFLFYDGRERERAVCPVCGLQLLNEQFAEPDTRSNLMGVASRDRPGAIYHKW